MKKTLGVIAVLGSAAALLAYKLKQEEKKNNEIVEENNQDECILHSVQQINEDTIEKEDFLTEASTKTVSFPHLSKEDMEHLNEISEERLEALDQLEEHKERPLQHTIRFEEEKALERFKSCVINEGYVVTTGANSNELLVLNIIRSESDVILSKIFYLADLAKEYQGTYVNWILK